MIIVMKKGADKEQLAEVKKKIKELVITSYSIHYTKLYDINFKQLFLPRFFHQPRNPYLRQA